MLSSKSRDKKDDKKSSKKDSKKSSKTDVKDTTPASPPAASAAPTPATPSSSSSTPDPKSSKKSSKKDSKKDVKKAPEPSPAASSTPVPIASSHSSQQLVSEPASSSSSGSAPPAPASSSSSPAASSSSSSDPSPLKHAHALKSRPNLSDVLILSSNGRSLPAHESILQIRCPRLASFLAAGQKKGVKKTFFKQQTIDLLKSTKQSITAETLDVVLQFIYGDNLDLGALQPMQVLQTCVAARALELPRLVRLCHDHLRTVINMNTVFPMFIYSFNPETKEDTVFSYCLDFAHQHIKEFVARKNDVASLGMPLFQEIVGAALEEYKPLPLDTSPVPPSSLIADFQRLFTDTVQGGPGQPDAYVMIGGTKIHFHKAILAAHTDGFGHLAPAPALSDCSSQLITNSDVSADAFTAMLRYIYYGDNNVSPIVGCNLAPYCARFKLQGLQNICENHIASNIDSNNVLSVLRVAYLPENQDRADMRSLRENGVIFVRNNLKSVDLSSLTQNPNIAVDILQAWKKSLE